MNSFGRTDGCKPLPEQRPSVRSVGRLAGLIVALVATGADAGANGASSSSAHGLLDPGAVTVRGRLTDEGVECQALRADDNELYTLSGDLAGFKAGDHVLVKGDRVRASFCMQGITLRVRHIERSDQHPGK